MEENLKPSIANSLYEIEKRLKATGLTEDDILVLIQKRVKGRPAKKDIKKILEGIKQLEQDLLKKRLIYRDYKSIEE